MIEQAVIGAAKTSCDIAFKVGDATNLEKLGDFGIIVFVYIICLIIFYWRKI